MPGVSWWDASLSALMQNPSKESITAQEKKQEMMESLTETVQAIQDGYGPFYDVVHYLLNRRYVMDQPYYLTAGR